MTQERDQEFAPRLDILPPPQLRLWEELIDVPQMFTLYGGTALALHLGHRESIDFDFFGSESFDPDMLLKRVPFLHDAEVVQREPDALTVRVDRGGSVLVSFFGVPKVKQIEEPVISPDNGVKIARMIDLAGMKASVVQKRATAKDYIDIAALIEAGVGLPVALSAGCAIYGKSFNPQITLKALSYFEDGDLQTLPPETKRNLQDAVRAVDLTMLPQVAMPSARQKPSPDIKR